MSDEVFTLELDGFDEMAKKIGIDVPELLDEIENELAMEFEQMSAMNMSERIYGNPESPRYVRTGSAQRGHETRRSIDTLPQYAVVWSSILGGASREYTPYLNQNSRIEKLDSHFFDDAVTEINSKASDIAQKYLEDKVNE